MPFVNIFCFHLRYFDSAKVGHDSATMENADPSVARVENQRSRQSQGESRPLFPSHTFEATNSIKDSSSHFESVSRAHLPSDSLSKKSANSTIKRQNNPTNINTSSDYANNNNNNMTTPEKAPRTVEARGSLVVSSGGRTTKSTQVRVWLFLQLLSACFHL